ncbi:Swt1 family HEPN domain-containing protein [uncultured Spirosoma sp.]|uniref:Swt1 family HEPN domain-containing protein n=1 Tax=uncultured Spirosoma sp. TaxID=278208 RepID=UPI00258F3894|nr:Swt1 family HEPN domain-containing protein [uncultured Spirosoma sp.]
MDNNFDKFCKIVKIASVQKIDAAVYFTWYNQEVKGETQVDVKTINEYFEKAHLPKYPHSRLKEQFRKESRITRVGDTGYKLKRNALDVLDAKLKKHFQDEEISVKEKAKLSESPFLSKSDIQNAHKMAEIYIVAHCFENSVRLFIKSVLDVKVGLDWWEKVSNKDLNDKFTTRKSRENKEKWVCSRNGNSPLYYLDWTDLIKIIRKEEKHFIPYIHELKFIELRFEELERVRNVIAHNGVIESTDDIDRLILYFKDWCRQLGQIAIS